MSLDFAGPRRYGDVIISSDETTLGVQTEARAELAFYGDAEELQLSDWDDAFVEILRVYNVRRGRQWRWTKEDFLGRYRRG